MRTGPGLTCYHFNLQGSADQHLPAPKLPVKTAAGKGRPNVGETDW
ncbi:hypothetical protein NKCBBBOE_02921 [Pseudarthrobacter sp. MM222]|nr:hypothetical protein NKCBBBOE_02921 [Pseudarthrobacter sp. MM222]